MKCRHGDLLVCLSICPPTHLTTSLYLKGFKKKNLLFGTMAVTSRDQPEDERANKVWKVVCLGPNCDCSCLPFQHGCLMSSVLPSTQVGTIYSQDASGKCQSSGLHLWGFPSVNAGSISMDLTLPLWAYSTTLEKMVTLRRSAAAFTVVKPTFNCQHCVESFSSL